MLPPSKRAVAVSDNAFSVAGWHFHLGIGRTLAFAATGSHSAIFLK